MQILSNKISDSRFMKLIDVLITAPILEKGKAISKNTQGCPQGSIISPVLANIYLHYVIDEWFENIKDTHMRGRAELVRYADDMVFCFEHMSVAKRFYEVLPKRLNKFGLQLHEGKSQIIAAGHQVAQRAKAQEKKLKTFNFLGFTCYWGRSLKGFWRLKYTSRKDRFAAKLKGMRAYLRENLNTKDTVQIVKRVIQVVRGWVNYHAVSDNEKRVSSFIGSSKRILWKWLNRRGGNRHATWSRLIQVLKALGFPERWKVISMF